MDGTLVNAGEDDRTGNSVAQLKRAIMDNLFYTQGKFPEIATWNDWYLAVACTVRDRLLQRWIVTTQAMLRQDVRAWRTCPPNLSWDRSCSTTSSTWVLVIR